jgi:predicted esterase
MAHHPRTAAVLSALALLAVAAAPPAPWWPPRVEASLARAGANWGELTAALARVPLAQREGMAFLIAHMPARDLTSLKAGFLLENVALAYRAREEAAWKVPDELFLNDVLPYAVLDEARGPWRREVRDACLPIIKGCKSPSEAAQKINSTLFGKLKVKYSTGRKRANQSPRESIDTGLASCTGLSILLVDACRSVGIPARAVGTPLWANRSGNHTWAEVWDGRWMFTGAAEQDPAGMDRGWFVPNASLARADVPEHAIYASSYRPTGLHFPLPWAPADRAVPAVNVTARYARPAAATELARVQVRVVEAGTSRRLALPVQVIDRDALCDQCQGVARGPSSDSNDHLTFELPRGRRFLARAGLPVRAEAAFATDRAEQLVTIEVPPEDAALSRELAREAQKFFEAPADRRKGWKFSPKLEALLARDDAAARAAAWQGLLKADIHSALRKDFDARVVRSGDQVSPYTVKTAGKKPEGGWPVFIALHGGGGVPKAVNDSQWKVMEVYYRDQPTVPGYLYIALRAPNDTWNGFYDAYVPPLIVHLIRQQVLFAGADPDKVFLMGYSHGGYGAFYIGPRIPDRFAAVHASAAAPSDSHSIARNLRAMPFSFMIGEKDTAYGRIERCRAFEKEAQKLREAHKGEYPVRLELKPGMGHVGLPDRDKVKEMYPHRRQATPRRVTWEVHGGSPSRLYWLALDRPAAGQVIDAEATRSKVHLLTQKVEKLTLRLDSRLVDISRPIEVVWNGKGSTHRVMPSLAVLCQDLAERGDPQLASSCVIELSASK